MFKVIIAGGRDFNNYAMLKRKVLSVLKNMSDIEIVSGGAKGTDYLGERLAKEMKWSLKIFPADWDNKGKSAGFIRNSEMAEYAEACICFWDGKSKGTKNMIETAKKKKLLLRVISY